MKKMIRRTAAMAISAFMVAQTLPITAIAAQQNDPYCDLTINPYLVTDAAYNALNDTNNHPSGTNSPDATQAANTGTSMTAGQVKFNITEVNADGSTKAGGITRTDVSPGVATTLTNGYYLIQPIMTQTGTTTPTTDTNFQGAEAFIIQLPVSNGNTNNRDVYIYPKLTDNKDTSGNTTDPDGNDTAAKHTIKLKKTARDGTTAISGAKYKLYYKNAVGDWVAGATEYETNASGNIVVDGLPLGKYYFVETSTVDGYLLDKNPISFTIDGVNNPPDIAAVNDSILKVNKNIAKDGAGDVYNWKITADVPSKVANLLSYTITDTYTGLSDTATDISVTISGMDEGAAKDFTVTKDATNHKVVVTLTSTGIGKLTGTSFDIIVSTKLAASFTDVENEAEISYQYAYDPDKDPELDGNPTVPDDPDKDDIIDDADIPDPDPTNPSNPNNPTPNVYPPTPDPGDPEPDPDDPTTPVDKVIPGTFYISNVNGNNELGGASYEVRKADGTTVVASANDSTSDPKIASVANLAPGCYKVYQVGVDADHIKNDTPITIYVGKDGNIYEDAECTSQCTAVIDDEDNGATKLNRIKFVNEPKSTLFNLPFTGTTATIVFSITGILLMAGTAFFIFIILKKRDDDEEEQENN